MSLAFSWYLTTPPAPLAPVVSGAGSSVGVNLSPAFVAIRGLIRPFVRDGVSDFASASGRRLIESKIGQIVGTRGSSDTVEGELPWRPEFGSLVHLIRHRNDDAITREMLRVYVEDALRRWLPSVRVRDVEIVGVEETGIDGATFARIHYEVKSSAGIVAGGTADVALPGQA